MHTLLKPAILLTLPNLEKKQQGKISKGFKQKGDYNHKPENISEARQAARISAGEGKWKEDRTNGFEIHVGLMDSMAYFLIHYFTSVTA